MKFPSPYGDFVFQTKEVLDAMGVKAGMFPSPYGDFVFQKKSFPSGQQAGLDSFRPLTGILFFK